jgi:hypothetical protein
MDRRAWVLFLGVFAIAAALQGAAACNGSSATPTEDAGNYDAGPPPQNQDSSTAEDTGTTGNGCNGTLPVMTVTGPDGGQIAPDWSCYADGAAFLYRPLIDDASDDATAEDAGVDSSAPDAAPDAGPVDAGVDSSAPDAAVPDASVNAYALHLVDFVSTQPPVGATVNIVWGGSSVPAAAFTGTVDDAGVVLFPAPPSGTALMSYSVTGAVQYPYWFLSSTIVPPPGRTEGNSIATESELALVTTVLGSQKPNAALAIIISGAEDCQFRDVNGGQFQVIDTTTNAPVPTGTSAGDPRVVYLQQNLPNSECTYTTNQGGRAIWAMVNAPVDTTKRYVIQFSGRKTAQSAPELIDSTAVETYTGSATAHRAFRLNAVPPN